MKFRVYKSALINPDFKLSENLARLSECGSIGTRLPPAGVRITLRGVPRCSDRVVYDLDLSNPVRTMRRSLTAILFSAVLLQGLPSLAAIKTYAVRIPAVDSEAITTIRLPINKNVDLYASFVTLNGVRLNPGTWVDDIGKCGLSGQADFYAGPIVEITVQNNTGKPCRTKYAATPRTVASKSSTSGPSTFPTEGKACAKNTTFATTGGNLDYDSTGRRLYCVNSRFSYTEQGASASPPATTAQPITTRQASKEAVAYVGSGSAKIDVDLAVAAIVDYGFARAVNADAGALSSCRRLQALGAGATRRIPSDMPEMRKYFQTLANLNCLASLTFIDSYLGPLSLSGTNTEIERVILFR